MAKGGAGIEVFVFHPLLFIHKTVNSNQRREMKLTRKQIEYGFNYFFKDEERVKSVVELSEYNCEKELSIKCTQLGYWLEEKGKKQKEAKQILDDWCDFLINVSSM